MTRGYEEINRKGYPGMVPAKSGYTPLTHTR